MRDLALAEGERGDIPVGVRTPCARDVALGGVLEDHDARGRVVVNGQIKAAGQERSSRRRAVQLSDRGTALDMPRVPGNRHDVVDGDVLGEEVEEVAGSARPARPCSMIRKNGSSAAKSARLVMGAFTMPLC